MYGLSRRDPFREMMTLRSAVDRLFDNALFQTEGVWQPDWRLAMDVMENDDEYVVQASIPGVNPDDLDITFNNDVLTIKGEVKAEQDKEGERYHLRERRYGKFTRSISLPGPVNADQIQAEYDAGILTLHLPKAEEAKPKRITVKSGSNVINGKVKEVQ